MTLVERVELTSSQASITFSNIPQDATDLLLLLSTRTDRNTWADYNELRINGSSTSFTIRGLQGGQNAVTSYSDTYPDGGVTVGNTATANTFNNGRIYFPNYTSNANKSFSVDSVTENNSSDARIGIIAGLWSNTAAITSLSVLAGDGTNLLSGSSFTLYKITKGSDGTTTVA